MSSNHQTHQNQKMLRTRSRDGSLARAAGSKHQLKIAVAVVIGVFCGAAYAFLHPKAFFSGDMLTKCHTAVYLNEVKKALFQCQSDLLDERYEFRKTQVDHRCCDQKVWTTQHEVKLLNAQKPVGPVGTDESIDPNLVEILQTVAVNRELIITVTNSNITDLLQVWFTAIQKLWIKNYLVVALDKSTESFCRKNYVPVYLAESNEEMKLLRPPFRKDYLICLRYRIIRDFLHLGYSVLYSDVDVVFLRNPFEQHYLHRDVDIEAMSDGPEKSSAYGFDEIEEDPDMGHGRYTHSIRIMFFNAGFFFIRPTVPSIELLDRFHTRHLKDKEEWDQIIFNEELSLPSRPGYGGLHASKRTLDIYLFLNSKTLFKYVRKSYLKSDMRPVAVHLNYHFDKRVRMQAVLDHYENQNRSLLDSLPLGTDFPW